ncbi:MAG TPA: hypothetical protein VF989_08995 [Polyangiaceae bacterium]
MRRLARYRRQSRQGRTLLGRLRAHVPTRGERDEQKPGSPWRAARDAVLSFTGATRVQ